MGVNPQNACARTPPIKNVLFNKINNYNIPHFWILQIVFWSGLSVITFLTLTLWYGQFGWRYISHTALQGAMGLALSMPLHLIFHRIWGSPVLLRIGVSIVAVAAAAGIWTMLRMSTFILITNEQGLWSDFGGWYFGGIFIFLCWTALYHGIRYFHLLQSENRKMADAEFAISEEKLKRLRAETKAKDAQLKMLRYQLNPHFLFNTLNALNSLVRANESDRAQRMIIQLSRFLRYSLDNNPEMKIPVEREVAALMLYLEIEKTRFGDRLTLDFEVDEGAKTALIPSLLLQPIIENSMKYAIAKSENGGTIRLRIEVIDQTLVLDLSDTGTATKLQSSKVKSADGRGIGLRNTIDRLMAFYGSNYDFDLRVNSSGGLETVIRIPFEPSPEIKIKATQGEVA